MRWCIRANKSLYTGSNEVLSLYTIVYFQQGGPNEVVCKSKSLYIGPNEVVPVRRDYKCTALPFIGRTLQGSASSARARARLLLQLFAINSAPPFYRRPELWIVKLF